MHSNRLGDTYFFRLTRNVGDILLLQETTPTTKAAFARESIVFVPPAIFVVLAIVGVYLWYSPIPKYDELVGYIHFNAMVNRGIVSAWWQPFGEHRPLIPRILYYLDAHFLRQPFVFLITSNLLMLLASIGILFSWSKGANSSRMMAAILCLVFGWMQAPNFYRGFDGAQWYSSILFVLLTIETMSRGANDKWFAAAMIFGTLAPLTMAQGLLALPIVAAMAAVEGLPRWKIIFPVVAAVVVFTLYFWNLPTEGFDLYLAKYVIFTLIYLGSPVYFAAAYWIAGLWHLFAPSTNAMSDFPPAVFIGLTLAALAGAAFVWFTASLALNAIRTKANLEKAAFLLFVIGCALMTAVGRTHFGVGYAVQERYTTASLFGWSVLLATLIPRHSIILRLLPVILLLGFLPSELRIFLRHP